MIYKNFDFVDCKKVLIAIYGSWLEDREYLIRNQDELYNEMLQILMDEPEDEVDALFNYINKEKKSEGYHDELLFNILKRLRHPRTTRRLKKYFIPQISDSRVLLVDSLCVEEKDYSKQNYVFREDYNIISSQINDKILLALGKASKNQLFDNISPTGIVFSGMIARKDEPYKFVINEKGEIYYDAAYKEYKNGEKVINPNQHTPQYEVTKEESICQIFEENNYNTYEKKLFEYKRYKNEIEDEEFNNQTNGYFTLEAFRTELTNYIKYFKTRKIDEDFYLGMKSDGCFVAYEDAELKEEKDLSHSERLIFDYYCYLEVNNFWEEIEAIRDLNHIKKPLFIINFINSFSDEEKKKHINSALESGRQVFYL